MNRRPKFLLHRNRSFWWGFLVLVFLVLSWITAMFVHGSYTWTSPGGLSQKSIQVSMGSGRIGGSWTTSHNPPGRPRVTLGTRSGLRTGFRQADMVKLSPELRAVRYGNKTQGIRIRSAFLPLWIPPSVWIPLWLWLMYRRDREEARLYGETEPIPDETGGGEITPPLPSSARQEPGPPH